MFIYRIYSKLSRWFSLGPPVSSTNKTDCHDITEILLKVALDTIKIKIGKGRQLIQCYSLGMF
jgi:hypothetical protein